MTKEIPFLGNYLVGIRLELFVPEEYDVAGFGNNHDCDSNIKEGIMSWNSI